MLKCNNYPFNRAMCELKIKIFSDGASRGNPGLSAIAFMILSENNKILKKYSKILGIRTNNQAEYEAIIAALEFASKISLGILECSSDSQLIVNQLSGIFKVRNSKLRLLWSTVKEWERKFQKIYYVYVPRSNQYLSQVDQLANLALDNM